ncbi:hypothetical protein F4553_001942 [Allocatelliglobosispora scoriae]|uniref:DUF2637 domain-containing protein n=1 Tax=Allocatelliglobosispora scoriae TaxID=643052 RepID=A0A841BNN1_9ACTN|nr:DUF2637 domain-containing protein [Allocatelliglobosispora scoriae]MBB5868563.1 hypothetical protein [Allocatelliglobosispora scoriae]
MSAGRVGRAERVGRVEGAVQVAIMLTIGVAAGAASFTHVHNVAVAHGQAGWLAWADAVVLELMSIASGLELRRRRRLHGQAGFPAWVLGTAVVLSLAAQVVEAERSTIGWIAAALPAAGFLAMVKIALGRTDTVGTTSGPRGRSRTGPGPDTPEPADHAHPATAPPAGTRRVVRDRSRTTRHTAHRATHLDQLLPAAAAAARELHDEGTPLTRHALATAMRRHGYQMSNATASRLLAHLRDGPDPATATDGDHPADQGTPAEPSRSAP